eukprot:gene24774-10415_t
MASNFGILPSSIEEEPVAVSRVQSSAHKPTGLALRFRSTVKTEAAADAVAADIAARESGEQLPGLVQGCSFHSAATPSSRRSRSVSRVTTFRLATNDDSSSPTSRNLKSSISRPRRSSNSSGTK